FAVPFAMTERERRIGRRAGAEYRVHHDPGKPALLSATDPDAMPAEYTWGHSRVAVWSGQLDPARGRGATLIDISPAPIGNLRSFPQTIVELRGFYDFLGGGDNSPGRGENPVPGLPYARQVLPLADYAGTLVAYWADGPFTAETPAGQLMVILNEQISASPRFEKRIGGTGPVLDELEWDVK